jgi:ParB-like chromosome segregation protein Spo0J
MELVHTPVSDIKEYIRNPRKHSDEQVQEIANSIKHFGWKAPILVDDTMTIISGHGRLRAAKLLGLDEVPVINTGAISPEDRSAYIIADNRLAEKSSWSVELLQMEFDSLRGFDFDLTLTGFDIETKLATFEPELQPTTASREVTENDMLKTADKMSVLGGEVKEIDVMCPHCGEEFVISGS